MKEVIIVNLTRMGDLIQSTPVFLGLKEQYHSVTTTLLINSEFKGITPYLPGVDRLITLNIRDLVRKTDCGEIPRAYREVKETLEVVNDRVYDKLINFTHSLDSAVLSSLIRTKEVRGVSIDDKGYSIKPDPWIRYFFNVIPSREVNPFHLCDMHLKVAGVMCSEKGLSLQIERDEVEGMKMCLDKMGVREGDRLVGLQLGASAEDKRWSVERFVELGRLLAERTGAKIILTGGPGEDELGREFKKRFPYDVINLIGDTSLGELISLIYLLDLFISNDTGPLHIATAVGTPTINISLGAVHFRETGPYSEGDYVFKADIPCSPCGFDSGCKNNICKEKIKPELVWLVADSVLNGRELETGDISQWEGVQLYRSVFCEDGMVDYIPLIRRSLTREDLFLNLYRKTWIGILDNGSLPNWQEEGETILKKLEGYYDIDPDFLLEATRQEYDALEGVSNFCRSALSILDVIKREGRKDAPDPELLNELWKNVRYINQQIEVVALGRISLRPLFIVFRYGLENLEGEWIPELAASASDHYRDLLVHSEALRGFMDFLKKRYHISPLLP